MRLIIIVIFWFSAIAVHSQKIDSTLARYASQYQPEKVWIHYDKASYYPGETIWFKAYFMEGLYPAQDSKTFYIDWVGDNGEVLSHSVSPIVEASAYGQFDIPESYAGNFVHVRAYTKWMLNFDTAFLYSKDIRILNKNVSAKAGTKPVQEYVLQFFPEGGNLVAGVVNKVAFKATDQWGIPTRVRGVVQDEKGAIVDSFRSVHDGMGFFTLLPQQQNSYTAKWKDEKGKEHTIALPAIQPAGLAMQVTVAGTKRYVSLQCNNNAQEQLKQVHIVGTLNQAVAFKADVELTVNNSVKRVIPTENLPSGILTITVFDANWNALAERITFINNDEYRFQPQMEVEHWGLNKRARNEIKITIPDSLAGANLSVSVTDAAIEKDTNSTIISHFLLTGDLKGIVYKPAYYFLNKDDSTVQNLDLVMLTNGWRRFKWEDVVKEKFPAITYPRDSAYLSLSGQVYGVVKNQLSGKETMFLFLKEKDSAMRPIFMTLNKDGSFSDPNLIIFDTIKVYYQLKSKLLGNAEAKFMTSRLPAFNYTKANFATGNPYFKDTAGNMYHANMAAEALRLQNMTRGKVMETVTVTAKTKPPLQVMDEKYAKGLFSGGDGYQFDLVNDPFAIGSPNIFTYLQGKVAGLQINTGGSTPSLSWRGGTPLLYVDEMQMDADFLSSLPVSDIAYIKVFRPPFMGGGLSGGSGGAIAIYTRRGDDAKNKPSSGGLSSNMIMGYTPIRQFYTPNYASFDKRNEQGDVRTTLYWNPMVIMDSKDRSAKLVFYNNDQTKSFRVVIEGMSKEGLLTHHEEIME